MDRDTSLKVFQPVSVNHLKRLGNDYDGGYVVHVPSLKDADYLLNYGVGYNVAFEKDFFIETHLPTLAFDPTLKSISLVFESLRTGGLIPFLRHAKKYVQWFFKEKNLKKYQINFIEEGIAAVDTPNYKTLAYHFKKYDLYDKKIILKIDVEGSEYAIFNDVSVFELLPNAIQILMEVHLIERNIENLVEIMHRIEKTHSLIHIHSNNHVGTFKYKGKNVPEAMEVTFLLNEYISEQQPSDRAYPVKGLDQPCDRLKEDILLDFFY
jgi:hypothetical protein